MNQNDELTNETFDQALTLLEQSDELTEQDVARLTADGAVMGAARELWAVKKGVERSRVAVPDADGEWQRVSERLDGIKGGSHVVGRNRWMGRHKKLCASLLAAAAVLLLIAMVWRGRTAEKMDAGELVYEATDAPREIVISTGKGREVVLGRQTVSGVEVDGESSDKLVVAYQQPMTSHIVESHAVTIPQGKMLKVVLSDGSEVWVNAGSRLVYPTCFVGSQRCVDLEGEAYFKVAPDAAHPFVVKTPGSQTCVLGTEFNIKSYRNQTEQITLVRGSVEVTVGKHGESSYEGAHQSMVLKPGQQLSVHNRQLSVQEVDTDIYTYWKDGFFFYDDERLDEIMRQIGSWYNVSVVFRNPRPRSYKIHFFCDRSSTVEQVVEQLNMLHKGYLKLTEGVIYVD